MTTCINRCVLMISLAMPGIRNGICNGCFYSIKGEPGRYIRERKLLLAARDLRDTDQRVYDICLVYSIRNRPLPARADPICRRGAYRKENHSRARRKRPSGLAFERKPATPHPARHQILNGAQC